MKKVTIIGMHKKKEIARKEVEMPETLKEAVHLEGGKEEEVLKLYCQARHRNIKVSISRPAGTGRKTQLDIKVELYHKLIAKGIKKEVALGACDITEADIKNAAPAA